MEENISAKLRAYISDYRAGMYSTDEVVGAALGLLIEGPDFKVLWAETPEWIQAPIVEFLDGCNENSTIYNFSSKSYAPIDPKLLELKHWLSTE